MLGRLLANFPRYKKFHVAVRERFHRTVHTPHLPQVFAKYIGAKCFTPLQQQQLSMFAKHQVPKLILFPAVAALVSYYLAFTLLNLPPRVHSYRIKKSYEQRAQRHQEYLENNPNYLPALLHGYNCMIPPS